MSNDEQKMFPTHAIMPSTFSDLRSRFQNTLLGVRVGLFDRKATLTLRRDLLAFPNSHDGDVIDAMVSNLDVLLGNIRS